MLCLKIFKFYTYINLQEILFSNVLAIAVVLFKLKERMLKDSHSYYVITISVVDVLIV